MQLKLFLLIMSGIVGAIIGYFLYTKDKEKEKYFFSIKNMATSLICDIRFSHSNIRYLVSNFENNSSLLNIHIKQFVEGIDGGSFSFDKTWLSENQFLAVKDFFNGLGRYDVETQIFQLEAARDKLGLYAQEISEHNKKFGKMKIKLGIMFGIAVGIFFL